MPLQKSNELMAYTYSHLYQIPATGLRFFTVYGPYGRPDMAYFLFTKKSLTMSRLKFSITAICIEILLILTMLSMLW